MPLKSQNGKSNRKYGLVRTNNSTDSCKVSVRVKVPSKSTANICDLFILRNLLVVCLRVFYWQG